MTEAYKEHYNKRRFHGMEYDWGFVWFTQETVHPEVKAFVNAFIARPHRPIRAVEPLSVITRVIPTCTKPKTLGLRPYVMVLDSQASYELLRQGWRSSEGLMAFIGYTPEQIEANNGKPCFIFVGPAHYPTFPSTWPTVFRIAELTRPDLANQLHKHGPIIRTQKYQRLGDYGDGVLYTREQINREVGCNSLYTGLSSIAQPESTLTVEQELFTRNSTIDALPGSALIQFNP